MQAVVISDLDLQIFSNHKRIVNVAVNGPVFVPFFLILVRELNERTFKRFSFIFN